MKQDIINRLNEYRTQMQAHGIDAAVIPQTDPHQSEYIAQHWQVRRFLSGFTGSAGTLVVLKDKALLWVDSRYFIQGEQQLQGTGIILMKDGLPGTPSIIDYLKDNLTEGQTVGIDGMLFSSVAAENMKAELTRSGITLITDFDIIDNVWTERPPLPKDKIFVHELKYAGQKAADKIQDIKAFAHKHDADAAFISPLDEIAWTLNIRCNDVAYNPVATSYLYISPERNILFIDSDKVDTDTAAYLEGEGVETLPYDQVKTYLQSLPEDTRILVEKGRTSITIASILGDRAVDGPSPVAVPKAVKNEVQIRGFRDAMVRDGVALVKAFMEIEDKLARAEKITEMDVSNILVKYRSQQPLFFDESFGTIAGYAEHGAIVHYEATPETNVELKPEGLLLVDSGAQYLDGTTDITRTISLGKPTADEKRDFTLVMKGHIALDMMIYPVGTRGAQLDAEARKALWKHGYTYLHGTGHGVGHFLNVHEGPQTIRLNDTPTPLMKGMITSNEPGLYLEGKYGIRCENLVLTDTAFTSDFGDFLKFESLTLYPFDLTLFDTTIMSPEEIQWVNDYHSRVYTLLSPHLTPDEQAWLKSKTAPLA